eukprot:4891186-Pleurochrysis_carterae.AAC.2
MKKLVILELVHQRKLANTRKNQNNRDRQGHPHHQQQLEGHHRVCLRQPSTAQPQCRWGRAGPR